MIENTRKNMRAGALRGPFIVALVALATLATAGCQRDARAEGEALAGGAPTVAVAASSGGGAQGAEVVATIDGVPVTMADLDELIGEQLAQMDFQYYSQRHTLIDSAMRRAVRDQLIENEAIERGITEEALIEELLAEQAEVTDQEVQSFYLQNQSQLQGRTLDQLYPQIRDYLETQRNQAALDEFADELRSEHDIEYVLEPFRIDLDVAGAPFSGPADAPVTLVEFSDFECPYCKRFNDTLAQVKANYEGRLRVVFMQFPLSIHPAAPKAAEASLCAAEQGKFWEAHDLYFAEQGNLGVPQLHEKAERLGLDAAAFSACLDSDKYAERVAAEMAAGVAAGVGGTPAVYVNGRPLPSGAVPYEMLAEIIDDEIARGQR